MIFFSFLFDVVLNPYFKIITSYLMLQHEGVFSLFSNENQVLLQDSGHFSEVLPAAPPPDGSQ